jgi:hypothetical protein
MRGHIKLFTLTLDLERADHFRRAGSQSNAHLQEMSSKLGIRAGQRDLLSKMV